MRRFYFFIFGFVFLTMLIPIIFIGISFKKNLSINLNFFPTPTPINGSFENKPNTYHPNIVIKNISPLDKSQNISLNTQIVISFSKNVNENDFSFWIAPDVSYAKSFNGNTITITPDSSLTSDTVYSFGLKYSDGSYSSAYTFSTVGTGIVNNSNYDNYSDTTSSFQKQNEPDIFLANQMPYSTETFYVNSDYIETSPSHYYFQVIMKGPDNNVSKNDFMSWVNSFGLGNSQIKSLDIRYVKDSGFVQGE